MVNYQAAIDQTGDFVVATKYSSNNRFSVKNVDEYDQAEVEDLHQSHRNQLHPAPTKLVPAQTGEPPEIVVDSAHFDSDKAARRNPNIDFVRHSGILSGSPSP